MSLKKELWLPGMDEANLIIPDEIEDFLDIQIPVNSTESEFQKMLLVNQSNRDFLNGDLDLDTYLDVLDYAEIDPFFHLQEAAWQIANLFDY
ncbi:MULTISPECIES: hypothetical protein [unclassified Microcoleus]|uniref:hypothetical protein n=1 Tax=unclassified Microcoleus TaxID=2642155 RepID=UPI002FD03BF6